MSELSSTSPLSTSACDGAHWRFILASSSPRRHELIKHLCLPFEIIPSTLEEIIDRSLTPQNLVLSLARQKAQDVFENAKAPQSGKTLVLGADTIVVMDGKFLGKPADRGDAFSMLRQLSGRTHEVYTGVAIITRDEEGNKTVYEDVERSLVHFRPLADTEIGAYIDTVEPMDKAGAYALQGTGSAFVSRIEGCFTNIIGLPIPKVVSLMRQAGVPILGMT